MRDLCLIMNRPGIQDMRSQPAHQAAVNQASLPIPQPSSLPAWPMLPVAPGGPDFHPSKNLMLDDNLASPSIESSQNLQLQQDLLREPKLLRPMILQAVQTKPRKNSWMDWMPSFFSEETPREQAPLIGPIDFPSMGSQIYIRQIAPIDDDTEHVVIHLINREPLIPAFPQHTFPPPLPQQLNHIMYFPKEPTMFPDSYDPALEPTTSTPQYDFKKNEIPSKISDENPWKVQLNPGDKETTKEKKPQFPIPDGRPEMHRQESPSKVMITFPKQTTPERAPTQQSSNNWSRPYNFRGSEYGRGITNPSRLVSATPQNVVQPAPKASQLQQTFQYASALQHYGSYSNGTSRAAAASESVPRPNLISPAPPAPPQPLNYPRDQIQRFKSPMNYLDEITGLGKAELTRNHPPQHVSQFSLTDDGLSQLHSSRMPRNQQSAPLKSAAEGDFQKQPELRVVVAEILESSSDGGLRIVPAPNLHSQPERNAKSSEEVLHNIMSMTASQVWQNNSTSAGTAAKIEAKIEAKKPGDAESKEMTTMMGKGTEGAGE